MRKFTRRSRRRRAIWTTVIALVVVMGVVLAVAVYSPLLALRHIQITGTDTMASGDVNSAVDDQLGTPLALLDFDKIKSELAQFPLIRSYVTETVPPDTLIIHVVEREPIGLIVRGTTYDEIDAAGVVLLSTTTKPKKLPIIAATGGTKSAAFTSAIDVLLAMPASVLTKVTTITATTPDDVRLKLTGNTTDVVWGSSKDSELKAKGLAAMLKLAKCKTQQEINVSAPHSLVCGPARETAKS